MQYDFSATELLRLKTMSVWENQLKAEGFQHIAGIDEAGRGPLAGPVVAAACILPSDALFEKLNDSKQLSSVERERLFSQIISFPNVVYGIGIVDVETIDRINILQATFLAMQRAVEALSIQPDYLLIDGNQLPFFKVKAKGIIQGDAKSISIAAASILAKVTRDRLLVELDAKWPEYGFSQNKGYGTKKHLDALEKWGPCPDHRKSFSPIFRNS